MGCVCVHVCVCWREKEFERRRSVVLSARIVQGIGTETVGPTFVGAKQIKHAHTHTHKKEEAAEDKRVNNL